MNDEIKKTNPALAEKETKETEEASLESAKALQKEVAEKEQRVNQQLEVLWANGKQQILGQQSVGDLGVHSPEQTVTPEKKPVEVEQKTLEAQPIISEPVVEEPLIALEKEKTVVEQHITAAPDSIKEIDDQVHAQVPAEYEEHELVAVKNEGSDLIKKG